MLIRDSRFQKTPYKPIAAGSNPFLYSCGLDSATVCSVHTSDPHGKCLYSKTTLTCRLAFVPWLSCSVMSCRKICFRRLTLHKALKSCYRSGSRPYTHCDTIAAIPFTDFMSPEERDLLQALGKSIMDNFAYSTIQSVVYGTFVLPFSISTYATINRGLSSRSARALFAVSIFGFLIASVTWSLNIAYLARMIRGDLAENLDLPLAEKRSLVNRHGYQLQFKITTTWTGRLRVNLYHSNLVVVAFAPSLRKYHTC
ncbi:hypothetical protein FPV67DRAFT_313265 [Lyophyllum atratum]|nr:hypothetical protein FPV67DRAFT_313265 [Lyophyllum atratum]